MSLDHPLHAICVLIVEDGLANRRITEAIVRRVGVQFDVAENGREAVNAVMKKDYDLVLMDCQMPVMDGFDAATSIRALETGARHTLIVALTASATDAVRADCLRAGMDEVLSKPFRAEDLNAVLARVVGDADGSIARSETPSG